MGLRNVFIWAVLFVVVFCVGLYFYVLFTAGGGGSVVAPDLNPGYNFTILETGVVDYGDNGSRSVYITYSVSARDVSSVEVEARRFNSIIPRDVYVLDYPSCAGCNGGSEFFDSLSSGLRSRGILAQDAQLAKVKINQLGRMGDNSILIVPTGIIPADLIDRSSDANLYDIMARGSVVIYVGRSPSQQIDAAGVTSPADPGSVAAFHLSYQQFTGSSKSVGTAAPFRMQARDFQLTGENASLVANTISVERMGNGYFVAFPETIPLGWTPANPPAGWADQNASLNAGEDIAEFIYQAAWQAPTTWGTRRTDMALYNGTAVETLFLNPAEDAGGYARVYVAGRVRGTSGEIVFRREYQDIVTNGPVNGRLLHANSSLNGSRLRFDFTMNESFPEPTGRMVTLYLKIYSGMQKVTDAQLATINTYGSYSFTYDPILTLPGGDYIMRITDPSDQSPKVYAQSFLRIPDVTVRDVLLNWEKPSLQFVLISSGGQPVPNRPVHATIDGKYSFDVVTNSEGKFTLEPSEVLAYGPHTFVFEGAGKTTSLSLKYPEADNPFKKWWNQAIIGGTILIVILGLALQRTEPPKYSFDVPDFPPQKRERVPIPRYALLNVLETTNAEYRWKYMPLSTQEIKANIRKKLKYQGRAVLVSDYNLEKLLGQLVQNGDVFTDSGLYGLTPWLAQSGKSARFLALFRTMRNFFINHAVLFTEVGQRQDCDTLTNFRGETMYIHVYEGDATIQKAVAAARKGRNYILFSSREELKAFEKALAGSYTKLAVALKMEMDNRQIQLATIDSLGKIIGMAS